MKKVRILLAFLAAAGCVTVHNANEDQRPPSEKLSSLHNDGPRKRILVLPFLNESVEKNPNISKDARDTFVLALKQTDNFIIIDNQDIPKDMSTFLRDGQYNFEEISKLANQLGIAALVEGKIRRLQGHRTEETSGLIREEKNNVDATVSLRAYSPGQHKEILSETRSGSSTSENHKFAGENEGSSSLNIELVKEALTAAYQGMVLPLVKSMDKLNWTGRIALVNGEKIYLNAGKLTGINIGDILRVSDEGEEIYDPSTGALIGQAPGRMKGTLEVVSFFGKDGCVTIVHSGSGFKENDHVELY
jgi:TolB-like protein